MHKTSWTTFYNNEVERLSVIKNDNKAKLYLDFLKGKKKDIDSIFYLSANNFEQGLNVDLKSFAKNLIGDVFININLFSSCVMSFLKRADRLYVRSLLLNQDIEKIEIEELIGYSGVVQSELKNPAIFIEYPKELATYKKMLKNWLMMNIEKRKRILKWDFNNMPLIYKKIESFASSLLENYENEYFNQNSILNYNYPKHIFPSLRCFKIVEHYCKADCSQKVFNYLYRRLRESKDPQYHIGISPGAFQEWHFQTYPDRNFMEIKDNLQKASTPERKMHFEVVKKLIEQAYK